MSSKKVVVYREGKEHGTYSIAEVVALFSSGALLDTDTYWHEGMKSPRLVGSLLKTEQDEEEPINSQWGLNFEGTSSAVRLYYGASMIWAGLVALLVISGYLRIKPQAINSMILGLIAWGIAHFIYFVLGPKTKPSDSEVRAASFAKKVFGFSILFIFVFHLIFKVNPYV